MFQFPAFASTLSVDVGIAPDGLPHSEIRGSGDICSSPRLIAACHVLRRLREPRHPPCALRPFRFIFMDARASLVSYLFSPCLFYRSVSPRSRRNGSMPRGARCVLLYEFMSSRSWSASRNICSASLSTASSLVIVLFPLRPVALTPPQPFIRWRITESNR